METSCGRALRRARGALAVAVATVVAGSGAPASADAPFGTPATAWLTAAYERKASGDLGGAVQAFEAARRAGADPQRVWLELAYAHLALGETSAARDAFTAAA